MHSECQGGINVYYIKNASQVIWKAFFEFWERKTRLELATPNAIHVLSVSKEVTSSLSLGRSLMTIFHITSSVTAA